jgi:uncharacterized Tic20 family protein
LNAASSPTPGERILSALAHFSIVGGGLGLFIPALVWVARRQKSAYTSFQALQALGYAILVILYDFIAALVIAFLILVFIISNPNNTGSTQVSSGGIWMIYLFVIAIGLLILPILLGIVAALVCLFGKEFCYPILGKCLGDYLQQGRAEGINPEYEDRFVAAAVHACVMFVNASIPYYIAAPLVALLYSKGRSQFLHFQSLQALVFQLIGTGISIGIVIVMYGMFALAMIFSGINPFTGVVVNSVSAPAIMMLLAALIVFMIFLLLIPVIQTFGLVAGYRVLKGKDYEYPLVGKLVKGWSWI